MPKNNSTFFSGALSYLFTGDVPRTGNVLAHSLARACMFLLQDDAMFWDVVPPYSNPELLI
nr:hypothetical protein Iba_scaffold1717CG0250 [Ipomoea batatas]GME20442.1 hypothetical protein Iba_scaffold25148CG0080 [Ipomoea batatas]